MSRFHLRAWDDLRSCEIRVCLGVGCVAAGYGGVSEAQVLVTVGEKARDLEIRLSRQQARGLAEILRDRAGDL